MDAILLLLVFFLLSCCLMNRSEDFSDKKSNIDRNMTQNNGVASTAGGGRTGYHKPWCRRRNERTNQPRVRRVTTLHRIEGQVSKRRRKSDLIAPAQRNTTHPCLAVFMQSCCTHAQWLGLHRRHPPGSGRGVLSTLRSSHPSLCARPVVSSAGIDDDKELTELNAEDCASAGTYQKRMPPL